MFSLAVSFLFLTLSIIESKAMYIPYPTSIFSSVVFEWSRSRDSKFTIDLVLTD